MGFKYSEVVQCNVLDADILENVPSHCEGDYGCGSELEITDNLNQLYCPNRYCTHKISSRLQAMAREMKVDGWGESTCLEVVKSLGLKAPSMIFLLEGVPESKYPKMRVSSLNTKLNNLFDKEKRTVQLWEMVRLQNIPGIANNALKLFSGYNNLTEAYEEFEQDGFCTVADKLGITVRSDSGVLATNTFNTLMEYKSELLAVEKHFNIVKPEGDTINMVLTGTPPGYKNKSAFVDLISRRFNGYCNINVLRSMSGNVDILVINGEESGKYNSAMNINAKVERTGVGTPVKIFTPEECIEYLEDRYF